MNISSVIVVPHPDKIEAVAASLANIDGVEVATVAPEGKIIITIETEADRDTIQTFEFITVMDGVLSASMVYHHRETDLDTEIAVVA